MKKTTLGIIILAVIALIITGFAIMPTNNVDEQNNENLVAQEASLSEPENTGAATETVIEQVQTLTLESQPEIPAEEAPIAVTPYSFVDQFSLVIAADDYNGESVEFYCDGNVKTSVKNINGDGTISFYVNKLDCPVGSDTYLMIGSHESEHAIVTFVASSGSGSPPTPGDSIVVNQAALRTEGVPYFTPITMLVAITIAGLGLAYLRKQ